MNAYPLPANEHPQRAAPAGRMKPGHWVLLIIGALLAPLGLGLAIAGTSLLVADAAQQDGQYLTGSVDRHETSGYALTAPSLVIDPGQAGLPGAPQVSDLASVQVRATSVVPGQEIFLGIADSSRVSAYLDGVAQAQLSDTARHLGSRAAEQPGTRVPAPPAQQDFWATSASGTGVQELTWDLQPGHWSLVVMNANATRPVWVDLQAGVRSSLLGPLGTGLLIGGLVGLVVGLPLLLLGAAGLGRDIRPAAAHPGMGPGAALAGPTGGDGLGAAAFGVYPVWFVGWLDNRLSRGLWLVKWLLAIPHYIILALLWFALVVTTIAAGVAILFTGRYPRSWFAFCVGVLRWSWRVGFYAYAALGTDRYPPFTLARADYPADLDVAYPERLSRGLVLVKWWLLAIPHLVIIAIFTGNAGATWIRGDDNWVRAWGPSLLGLLVFIAAVILLFTGRYRLELFNFIVGIDRWVYRVGAYVLLLRDEYPPFRLDQGPADPPATGLPPAGPGPAAGTIRPQEPLPPPGQ
ncbi:DUF4389 domain-containing protein [Arthrobacter sp. I2-34]|uniref:DUF4389 domain-containing protein n=1 Tax=Arthrobacter hankyongi TaxID=2904801 RepID=A0ABS9L6A4_9MICC|nr:DUF4389 domain-containing protein [Arthrobacter hankyongi]MCG2622193.1 DUF4389 domain-containing protein [Arthrobacter hankyongi]